MKFNKNEFGWKEKANTNELPDDVSIKNSLTVGTRIGDIGEFSVTEGVDTTASGTSSHAEGERTTALGVVSHAEGSYTIASGYISHAEGISSTASGNYSHAEGRSTTASGECSHVEGNFTTASGIDSHAEGSNTIASSGNQHVQGKYNIEDTTNTYAHIVGNGTADNARSNAHTLDWQGNGWYAGKLSQDGVPTEDKDLTTKKYVDDNDMRMLEYVYEGNVFKITLTDEQFENFGNLQSGEYIVLDSILPEDIYKCTDTGSIWYGCILINNISFKVGSFGSLKINTIKSDNAINFYTENTYYNSSTQAGIFRHNFSLAVLNDTEEVVLVKCNDLEYHYASTEYINNILSFNDSGELVVTINGVSKTFVPKPK